MGIFDEDDYWERVRERIENPPRRRPDLEDREPEYEDCCLYFGADMEGGKESWNRESRY